MLLQITQGFFFTITTDETCVRFYREIFFLEISCEREEVFM